MVEINNQVAACVSCYLKPLTNDDFQYVSINHKEIESGLMDQLRIITTGFLKDDKFNTFPIWLKSSPNIPIFLKLIKAEPANKIALLLNSNTKLVIVNNDEVVQSNEQEEESSVPTTLKYVLSNMFKFHTKTNKNDEISKPELPADGFVKIPIYSGEPLMLRLTLSKNINDYCPYAFVSSKHFQELKNLGVQENYCVVKLKKVINNSKIGRIDSKIDLIMPSQEKFCSHFLEKYLQLMENSNECYLILISDDNCPEYSIMLSRWFLMQYSLQLLTYVALESFDPEMSYVDWEIINNCNYLSIPILKEAILISFNNNELMDNNAETTLNELNTILLNETSNTLKHLILFNGNIFNLCDKHFQIIDYKSVSNSRMEVLRLSATCFIINHKTKFSLEQVNLPASISNYFDKLNNIQKSIDEINNIHDEKILLKPFAGFNDVLNDCIKFVQYSLNLSGSSKNYNELFTTLLVTGKKGSGKTTLIERILYHFWKNYSTWSRTIHCAMWKRKNINSVQKHWTDLLDEAIQRQPSILVFEDLSKLIYGTDDEESAEVESNSQPTSENFYNRRLSYVFFKLLDALKILKSSSTYTRVCILVTADSLSKLHMQMKNFDIFDQIMEIPELESNNIIEIIKEIFDKKDFSSSEVKINTSFQFDMKRLSKMTKSFTVQQLNLLIDLIIHYACLDALNDSSKLTVLEINDTHVLQAHKEFNSNTINESSDFKLNTNRYLKDVGGLNNVKEMFSDYILFQIKYPKLNQRLPIKLPNSLLLYGMPGTGKTTIVEAFANETELNFINVKGPELLSKYIGNSEQSVRRVFRQAKELAPCILFFDEFDSLVPRRGHDNTGVTDRVVNQMLTLLDGVEERNQNVFILAATSRPDLIDLALLRPGRFDQVVYCPMPTEDERREILLALSAKLPIDVNSIPFNQLVKSTENFSGADIQALLYNAYLEASKQTLAAFVNIDHTDDDTNSGQQNIVSIHWKHIQHALNTTKPSLSENERNRFLLM